MNMPGIYWTQERTFGRRGPIKVVSQYRDVPVTRELF